MDKETLSNYGWIVICVLVLAVMLALAGPFGTFVAGAVKSTTAGLFGVNQNALGAAGIEIGDQVFENCEHLETEIRNATDAYTGDTCCKACGAVLSAGTTIAPKVPEGGLYTAADGTVYNPGDEFPETVTTGDIYEYDGYRYSYNRHVHHSNFGLWETDETQNGWGVMDYDCGTVPSPILESINGKPITDLRYAFAQEDITTAPTIPSTVTNMGHAFYRCSNLTDISKIIIPNGMTNMEHAFQECKALTDASTLIIPNSVTDIYGLFWKCSSLTTAPVIPSSILDMGNAFLRCTSLTGSITINTNHINNTNIGKDGSCYSCFSGVDFVAQNITLTGSASKDVLNLIGSTGINWTPIS